MSQLFVPFGVSNKIPGTKVIILAENQISLEFFLGHWNVFVDGYPWSYSQQGDFTSASWDVEGESINVTGPHPQYPVGKLIRRFWNVHNKLIIIGANGQSDDIGQTANNDGDIDPTTVFTQLNPIPRFECFVGGVQPIQGGIKIDHVNDIINAAQYASLVPAKEGINTGRTPGEEFTQEEWCTSFAECVAAAVPPDNVVLLINVGHGGALYSECMVKGVVITSLTWSAGQGTVVFAVPTYVGVGDTFLIRLSTNAGWNGTFTALFSFVNGTTVIFSLPVDPGAAHVGALGAVWSPPMVNLRTMVRDAVNIIAPALGLDPYFGAFAYDGNQSNTDITDAADWVTAQWDFTRPMINELGTICGNFDALPPWVVWPQPAYTMFQFQSRADLQGAVNPIAFGLGVTALDLSQRLITFAEYSSLSWNDVASPHWWVQGHSDNGERGANLYLDAVNSITTNLIQPQIDASFELVRVANSTTIVGKFLEPMTVDTTGPVSDPGQDGMQYMSGVYTNAYRTEDAIDSVTIDPNGVDFTVELTSLPADSGGNYLAMAFANATTYTAVNSTIIQNSSWAANVGTYNTLTPHGLVEGSLVTIIGQYPAGYSSPVHSAPALAGTTGTVLKVSLPAGDPGIEPISTITWANGIASVTTVNPVILDPANYVTISGTSNAVYHVNRKLRSVTDTTHFTYLLGPDPGGSATGGGFIGGGNLAIDGGYGTGSLTGLRSRFRAPDIEHYSERSGAAFPRWAQHQLLPVTTYASTNGIAAALAELNMDSLFELVLDSADIASYSGSGTSWVSVGASGATNNFDLAAGALPTFNGVAGALDRTDFFSASANGKFFSPAGTPDVLLNAHKYGGEFTIIVGGFKPTTTTTTIPLVATTANGGPGIIMQCSSTGAFSITARGAAGASVFAQSAGFAPNNDFFLLGASWANRNNASWMLNQNNGAGVFTFLTPAYVGASASAAESKMTIWRNGATGALFSNTGCRIMFLLVGNTFIPQGQIQPLYLTLYRRHILGL